MNTMIVVYTIKNNKNSKIFEILNDLVDKQKQIEIENELLYIYYRDKYNKKMKKYVLELEQIDVINTDTCINTINMGAIIKLSYISLVLNKAHGIAVLYDTICDRIMILYIDHDYHHVVIDTKDEYTIHEETIHEETKNNQYEKTSTNNTFEQIVNKIKKFVISQLYLYNDEITNKSITDLIDYYIDDMLPKTDLFKHMDEKTRLMFLSDDFKDAMKEYTKMIIHNHINNNNAG